MFLQIYLQKAGRLNYLLFLILGLFIIFHSNLFLFSKQALPSPCEGFQLINEVETPGLKGLAAYEAKYEHFVI